MLAPERDGIPVFGYVLVKLASRCNLACTYCYWFRDATVLDKPPLLTHEAESAFCERLERHLKRHRLDYFQVLFHGGEPLLFPKRRMAPLLERLRALGARTDTKIEFILTTNGALLDDAWMDLFDQYDVGVSVSIDGPPAIHDEARVDHKGRGSYAGAARALRLLQSRGRSPGTIAVCNPAVDPLAIAGHLVDELGLTHFDVLPPDATHEDNPASIADYYIRLFDYWYDHLTPRGITIRFFDGIIRSLLGRETSTDSIGYAPVHTVTLLTDGALEPLDVLRIAGDGSTASSLNIFEHDLQDVDRDPVWMRAFTASQALAQQCEKCSLVRVCGGGHLAHRWSRDRGYDNPSVYCADLIRIIAHVRQRLAQDICLEIDGVSRAMATIGSVQWFGSVRNQVGDSGLRAFGDLAPWSEAALAS